MKVIARPAGGRHRAPRRHTGGLAAAVAAALALFGALAWPMLDVEPVQAKLVKVDQPPPTPPPVLSRPAVAWRVQ